jgi:Neuralized
MKYKDDLLLLCVSISVISEPLVFHDVHAETIEITNNRRRAHRVNGLQGMCFSQRPILQNELVCMRITESSSSKRNKGGIAMRFGYTAIDPSTGNLRAISDLASAGHGYWVKAVADSIVKRGVAIFFYLSESGEVIYGRKDKDYGVLFSGVRTGVPLWVVIDMAGSALTLEFLGKTTFTVLSVKTKYALVDMYNSSKLAYWLVTHTFCYREVHLFLLKQL